MVTKHDEILRAKLTDGLSQGQADAMMLIIEFLSIPDCGMFVLKGYAGTGKTYLVKKVVDYITHRYHGHKIAVTAPTNKAVQVLMERRDFSGKHVLYRTVHSLLGLTENIDMNGKVTFTSKGDGEVNKVKYLIVDETSMLQDEIFHLIKKFAGDIKIIFMGDGAQIPPVGKTDCIPFKQSLSERYEEGYTLTEIMRQAKGNPIIEESFKIRDNLASDVPIPTIETRKDFDGHGITWLNPVDQREELLYLLDSHFNCPSFRTDPNYAKVIAWRNKMVDAANTHIRKMIYGEELKKIMPGEMLLANKPIFDEGEIQFNTSEEMKVDTYNIRDTPLSFGSKKITIKTYHCVLNRFNLVKSNIIKVIHEDSQQDYNKYLEELKQRAIDNKGKGKLWIDYYDALKWPADICYNYAITAHKAQGSTYENVFIMEDDMNANRNVVERNRIKYTSYSRASKNLYVYRRNPF